MLITDYVSSVGIIPLQSVGTSEYRGKHEPSSL